uniref:Uncharacterized protein n=1 Tax=Hyaloperonospora arabidopsidis (strain Emoy2) TaxID=559515 RepID=M4BQG4_HYAAE
MYQGLDSYRLQSTDPATNAWLDIWKSRTTRAIAGQTLAPLIDNTNDRKKLRASDYGGVGLLRLCDFRNKRQCARHVICAILHNDGNKALTSPAVEADGEILDRLRRHIAALSSSADNLQAFRASNEDKSWSAIHTFLAKSLAHESIEQTHRD